MHFCKKAFYYPVRYCAFIYEIALEAHKRDTLIIFKKGTPEQRIVARDLGGLYIHIPALQQQNLPLPKDAPQKILTTDTPTAHYKILHIVYQDHFIKLVYCFCSHYHIEY